MIYLQVTIIS